MRSLTVPKESDLNCRVVVILLEAVCFFLQISPGLKLGHGILRIVVKKLPLNSPGLLFSFSLFD